jgi:hypothetical protein
MTVNDQSPIIASRRDIFHQHGLVVWGLYILSEVFSILSISRWLRRPPAHRFLASAVDQDSGKPKAWWQDAVFLVLLLAGTFIALLSCISGAPSQLATWLAWYFIYDGFSRHVRVQWFDDIEPRIQNRRRRVWSHRRILFIAILSYAQSILLFGVIYLSRGLPTPFERSFGLATLLALPTGLTGADVIQVMLSLFFLSVVIATAAANAYNRGEIAPHAS